MNFNFSQARVRCSKKNSKVHVCKALINMKEAERRDAPEAAVLSKAVEYIKALEAEVFRLASSHTVSVTNNISVTGDAKDVAESVGRGLLGRLFMGERQ